MVIPLEINISTGKTPQKSTHFSMQTETTEQHKDSPCKNTLPQYFTTKNFDGFNRQRVVAKACFNYGIENKQNEHSES